VKRSFQYKKKRASASLLQKTTLEGVVDRITFRNEENCFTILRLECDPPQKEPVTVVGSFPTIEVGETLRLTGQWGQHPQFGDQFETQTHETIYPHTIHGIRKYLGSGLIKGIGEVYAKRIVEHFKLDTLSIIDTNISRLREVDGIGAKRLKAIREGWDEHRSIKDIMVFLASHNVSINLALRIYRTYGKRAAEVVQHHPYQLVHDVTGVGFISADRIAQDIGIASDSPERMQAGVFHILSEAQDNGHCFYPMELLAPEAEALLNVGREGILEAVETLKRQGHIVQEGERMFLQRLHLAEQTVAKGITRLIKASAKLPPAAGADGILKALERIAGLTYDESQREAILTATGAGVCVMTGGPGTGKTTTVRGIIGWLDKNKQRYLLAAPTGRAAKRLEETTGRTAKTIHRLLEYNPRDGGFTRSAKSPLDTDVVIIDEASMIDILLFQSLIEGMPRKGRLVLVGDIDQLPSVGPGNVLKDLIAGPGVAVVRLNRVYRQGEESDIVGAAHAVNQGESPQMGSGDRDNIFFIHEEEAAASQQVIQDLCTRRLPARYGLDPVRDIQVLTPMHKGEVGARALNDQLQQALNPNSREVRRGERLFRVGDKVLQVRNDYDKQVFNGDIGRITGVMGDDYLVKAEFEGRQVTYQSGEMDELALGYALTVHKSQGSEYKAVVMPVTTQHFVMLQRNLLYTAMTRARELLVLVGTKKALHIAIRNNKVGERYTALTERIQQSVKMPKQEPQTGSWQVESIHEPPADADD
jgi:exodeoxyribonuclease V alpha subunit